jgi:hypothetical protein
MSRLFLNLEREVEHPRGTLHEWDKHVGKLEIVARWIRHLNLSIIDV